MAGFFFFEVQRFERLVLGVAVPMPPHYVSASEAHVSPPFHPAARTFAEPALAPRNRAAASPHPLSRNNCGVDSAPPGGTDRVLILGIHRLNIKDNRNAHRPFPVI